MPKSVLRLPSYQEHLIKRELCDQIRRGLKRKWLTAEQWAAELHESRATLSYIINKRVNKISFNQLMRILIRLHPNMRLLIAMD